MPIEPASIIANILAKRFFDKAFEKLAVNGVDLPPLEKSIIDHHIYVDKWSSSIQILNMAKALSVQDCTIELTISNNVKRLYSNDSDRLFSEIEILEKFENFFLFGGPGAGKTTTVKRLCRKLLFNEPNSDADQFQAPFLIRCRDVPQEMDLISYILSILSIKLVIPKDVIDLKQERNYKLKFISETFDMAGYYVFLDGIDECNSDLIKSVFQDITDLARSCEIAKFLCTCRSGFATSLPQGFSALQIEPLSDENKKLIISKWGRNPDKTLKILYESKLNKIISRPLFLVQLIILFDWHGFIPDKPSEIYSRLITLMIEIWDNQKGAGDIVHRVSRYDKFTPMHKFDFLGSLAYFLVKREKLGGFTYTDFQEFYSLEYTHYGLPIEELDNVLNEIETHTGFISECGFKKLEFLHLTFQEHMAASYLINDVACFDRINNIATINYSVFAIVVAMSRFPGDVLARVMHDFLINPRGPEINFSGIFERLYFELPILRPSVELGRALIALEKSDDKRLDVQTKRSVYRFINKFKLEGSIAMGRKPYLQ